MEVNNNDSKVSKSRSTQTIEKQSGDSSDDSSELQSDNQSKFNEVNTQKNTIRDGRKNSTN